MDTVGILINSKQKTEKLLLKKICKNLRFNTYFLEYDNIYGQSLEKFLKIKLRCILYSPGSLFEPIPPLLLKYLQKNCSKNITLLSCDDLDTYINNFPLLKYIHCVYTNSFLAQKLYSKYLENVFFWPWGFSSKIYGKNCKVRNYKYDVGFLGTPSSRRKFYLDILPQMSKPGNSLRSYVDFVNFPKMAIRFRETKINLHISSSFNASRRRMDFRVWEVMGSGGFLLCEYVKGIEQFFKIGEEIVCFKTKKELKKLINGYLKNNKQRERIRINGSRRVLKEYNLLKNFSKIINTQPILKDF